MNLKDSIEILIGIIALIGWIYQLASFERRIYERIAALEAKLNIHMTDYQNRRESVDYRMGELNHKIEHSKSRLWEQVSQIQRFLEKRYTFRVREGDE